MKIYYQAFKIICHCLSSYDQEDDVSEIQYRLTRDDFSWRSFIDIANAYFVATGIWSGLTSKGLEILLDDEPRQYFSELHALNLNRNKHLRKQLIQAIGILNAVGITPLLLKGASQLVQPIHIDIGSRLIADLDILIPPNKLSLAVDALTDEGYEEAEIQYDLKKLHHWAPLIRRSEYGEIELHHQALNRFVTHVMPTQRIIKNAEPGMMDGVQFLLPCPTHSIVICLLHSQNFNSSDDPRMFNLRAIHDLTAINMMHSDRIDWLLIHRIMKDNGLKNLLETYLLAAQRLFGMALPTCIVPGPSARLYHIINIAVMCWPLVELLSRRVYDFTTFRIHQRYGCPQRSLALAAYRMRYLASHLKMCMNNAIYSV